VLNGAGIVERRKEGTTAYYRVVDVAVFELCELVCGALQEQLSQLTTLMEVTR
jgi:ArsR family transcriptional regulator